MKNNEVLKWFPLNIRTKFQFPSVYGELKTNIKFSCLELYLLFLGSAR